MTKKKELLLIKLGSLAVHIEEYISSNSHHADLVAIQSLLADPDIKEFLTDPKNKALLPVKRTIEIISGPRPHTTLKKMKA